MKRLFNFLLIAALAAALGFALWRGFAHRAGTPDADEETKSATEQKAEEKEDELTVHLEKEKAEHLGLATAHPTPMELAPGRRAFGRVLDPTPLLALDGELAAAEAALAPSRAEHERTRNLLAAGENASRKAVETAEAQFRADEIRVDGLRRRAQLEWGPAIASQDAAARRALIEPLVSGEAALVRVDLLPGDLVTSAPKAAQVLVLGRESEPLSTEQISPATDVDPKTQAQGYLLRVEKPAFPLRPGMAVTAWLELPEKPRPGFAIPRSAILRQDGLTWVYLQKDEVFSRRQVALESPLPGDGGWFVTAESGLTAEDELVVTGPQMLLSEEMKGQGGAPD